MMDRAALCARFEAGDRPPLLLFWGHTPTASGHHVLSQWWWAPFVVDGITYPTAEHWMMAEKARLFGDDDAVEQILAAPHPGEAKRLGRGVRGYDDARWGAARAEAVVRGNVHKFGRDPALRAHLLGTGDAILVEASPRDAIWGIGLGAANPAARDPRTWRGRNLLGFALVEARRRLREGGA
jgi:ribA/ribD-fused uncharacterized protein